MPGLGLVNFDGAAPTFAHAPVDWRAWGTPESDAVLGQFSLEAVEDGVHDILESLADRPADAPPQRRPRAVRTRRTRCTAAQAERNCAMCAEPFHEGHELCVLSCGCYFHCSTGNCPGVGEWMVRKGTCPCCRTEQRQ
jgi:hypothetical protein